ncbi:MAG: hypothetical protein ABIZ70_04530 [Gemmatimonadales bacterium]
MEPLRVAVRWSLLLCLLCATTGCDTPEVDSSPPFVVPVLALPAWRGGFDVGRERAAWTDSSRNRTLLVTTYYPALILDTTRQEVIAGDSVDAILHRDELARKLGPAAASGLLALHTRAVTGAALAPWDERFPVLLFAPGAGWLPGDYSSLLEGIASHGFVVIAVAAPGEAGTMRMPNGEIARPRVPDDGMVSRLSTDLAFLHQRLVALDTAVDSRFSQRLALGSVGVFGHGVGGAAAVRAAARDTTLSAVANLDGDLFLGFEKTVIGQPILFATTEPLAMARVPVDRWSEDRSERRRGEQWDELSGGSRRPERVRLPGMHQWNFLDAALVPSRAMAPGRRRPRFGNIDGARGLALAVDLTSQFFRDAFASSHQGFNVVRTLYPEVSLGR